MCIIENYRNEIVIVIFQKQAELAARRATFEAMFEEKKEETESRTYDLNKHLVTVTEVAEVDLADKGTHLGLNQVGVCEEQNIHWLRKKKHGTLHNHNHCAQS